MAVAMVGLAVLAGCASYRVGNASLYPPHIRTVYVPVFESASYRRNLGERLTEAVMKEIEAKLQQQQEVIERVETALGGESSSSATPSTTGKDGSSARQLRPC